MCPDATSVNRVEYRKYQDNELRFAIVDFFAGGKEDFADRSTWETKYRTYRPCEIERSFAIGLSNRPRSEILPLLDLDATVREHQVAVWINEPLWMTDAMQELEVALRHVSLRRFDGERRLCEISGLIDEAPRLMRLEASFEDAKDQWLEAVDRIVRALRVNRDMEEARPLTAEAHVFS